MADETLALRDEISLRSVSQALQTQSRVIAALILRESKTRYGTHKLGFLWALLEPIVMVAVFVALFMQMRTDSPGGMPLVTFMLTGIVPFMVFRDPMNQMQTTINQNKTLFAFPQVTTYDVILARGLLEVLILIGVFAFLLSIAALTGFEVRVERPLEVVAALGLLAAMGLGLGFLFASLLPILPSMRQVSTAVLGRPLFLSSGLFFTADSVPDVAREYLLYNPVLHLLELLRSAFFAEFESPYGDWTYASLWSFCVLAVGLLTHRALRKRSIVGL